MKQQPHAEESVQRVNPPLDDVCSTTSRYTPVSNSTNDDGRQDAGSQVVTDLLRLILETYI